MAGYPGQFGNVLIKKESFDKFINTMVGVPVIINHKDITAKNANDERVGVVSNVWFDDKDGWYWCDGVIWDEAAQNLITDKGWSVSCSYDVKLADDAGGTENNIPYDIEFLDGVFTHLAIVDNPRYERANIVFNSKTVVQNFDPNQKRDKNGRWTKENYNAEIDRILKGELKSADRIKVVEHPSEPWLKAGLQDAEMLMSVKTYDKATTDKHNVSEETMRNLPDLINDPLYIFKSSTVPGSYVGVLDDYEEENGIKKPLIAVVKPEHGKIDVNLIPSVYGKDPDFPYREVFKNNLLYERLDKNKTVSNNIIASIAMETLKPSNNIITDIQKDFNPMIKNNVQNWNEADHPRDDKGRFSDKESGVSQKIKENDIRTKEGEKQISRGYTQLRVKEYQKAVDDDPKSEGIFTNDDGTWLLTEVWGKGKDKDGWDLVKGGKVIKHFNDRYEAYDAWDKGYFADIDSMDKQPVHNNKEQDMALLDELKKLITKVENDKGEDMDDNKEKIENEKVDKRKLIDEVAGIMKSVGADDEKIRTAIAKMEKLAYDKSEAGTADNEKEDELKEDKLADNSKVKNEESKEDEKKYDDLKKDVKEDVENKCKNSVDNAKGGYFDKMNEIYNAATQPAEENTYISREQKLKYAEDYFAK